MRVVRLHRFADSVGVERSAEFPICHDEVLRGGGSPVWRLFLAAYLINQAAVRFCAMGDNLSLVQQFSGYAMVVVFLLRMVLGILPDFQIIAMLLQFYTVYVAWEGSARLLQVSDANRLRFTLTASVLLIVCPMLIEWIFNRLTIMLN